MTKGLVSSNTNPVMLDTDLHYSLMASVGVPSSHPIPCRRAVTLIGSRKGCKLTLEHAHIAPVHLAILNDGSKIYALDLVTRLGVKLNGLKMSYDTLSNGDVLNLHTWEFRISLKSTNPPLEPIPISLDSTTQGISLLHLSTGQVLKPQRDHCLIGRRQSCDIALADNRVSRAHAILFQYKGQPAIFDLLTRNHTLVNDEPVEFRLLNHDDVIGIGDSRFKVQLLESVPPQLTPKVNGQANGKGLKLQSLDTGSPEDTSSDLINIHATESSQRWKIADKFEKTARKS